MRWIVLCLSLVVLVGTLGCGGSRDHGKFKDKDRPRAAPAEQKAKDADTNKTPGP